jgi:hypothetical protein
MGGDSPLELENPGLEGDDRPLELESPILEGGGTLELADLIERLDPSAERYVPRLRYYLIHVAKVPLALLEASDSPVVESSSPAWGWKPTRSRHG